MLLLNFVDPRVVNQGGPMVLPVVLSSSNTLSMAVGSFAAAVAQVRCSYADTSHQHGF
jgi:hypothetical protein